MKLFQQMQMGYLTTTIKSLNNKVVVINNHKRGLKITMETLYKLLRDKEEMLEMKMEKGSLATYVVKRDMLRRVIVLITKLRSEIYVNLGNN